MENLDLNIINKIIYTVLPDDVNAIFFYDQTLVLIWPYTLRGYILLLCNDQKIISYTGV